jgi:hypothetical protein
MSEPPHVLALAQVATGTGIAHSPEAVAKESDPEYHPNRWSKPARERRVGMSVSNDGAEGLRWRDYDRKGDWYEETVLNPDGTIRHHQAEPLSAHTRHGSDKDR